MFELPKEFDPRYWDKAKSTADKLKKESGLGNKLKDIQKRYNHQAVERIERAFKDGEPRNGLKDAEDWLKPYTRLVENLQKLAADTTTRKDLSNEARTAAHNISEAAKDWLASKHSDRVIKLLEELQYGYDQRMIKNQARDLKKRVDKARKIDLAGALDDLAGSLEDIKEEHFVRHGRGRQPLPIDQLRARAEMAQRHLDKVTLALEDLAKLCRTHKVNGADSIQPWAKLFDGLARQYPQYRNWAKAPDDNDGLAPGDWPRIEKLMKAVQQAKKDPLFGKRQDWLE